MRHDLIAGLVAIAIALIFGAGILTAKIWDNETVTKPEYITDSLFEAQGAITFGCALWSPVDTTKRDPDDRLRDLSDFIIIADNNDALFIVVHGDTIRRVSGLRCGISVDWRRFPTE